MSPLVDRLTELRSAIQSDQQVVLEQPVTVDELVVGFGPARELPRLPAGGRRAVFPATQPGDGERGVTVLADLDSDGLVTAVYLRVDDFRPE